MAIYQLGSGGTEVRAVQEKLQALGDYLGPADGNFGGGTQAAVIRFQARNGLQPDGRVGSKTWKALFSTEMPPPAIIDASLLKRCLALTGAFETGSGEPDCFCGINGDFDGQGISFGVLQWNLGQRSLQPLLKDMLSRHPRLVEDIFGSHCATLAEALRADHDDLMSFARSIQHPVTHRVFEPWRGYAKALGRTREFQDIQAEHAQGVFRRALALCEDYRLWSERGVALMFDVLTQNGSINHVTRAQIKGDLQKLPSGIASAEEEVRTLEIVATRRAEAADPRWRDDVRTRKLCIAQGKGIVHGIPYDLQAQFGLGLQPYRSSS